MLVTTKMASPSDDKKKKWSDEEEIELLNIANDPKYKNIIKGKDLSQNLKLKADDTIIVP